MRKTYITSMPDQAGAFLRASRIIAQEGGNLVRVNYNKAVDMHILFIDVEADEEKQAVIKARLTENGYLDNNRAEQKAIMIEMKLADRPGTLEPVLVALRHHEVNINYMNAQGDGTGFQMFRMGLLIENPAITKVLLDEIAQICPVRIMDYHVTDKALDSTVFYLGFANEMSQLLNLDQKNTNKFIILANQIMQNLDEIGEMPLKTFEYLGNYARFVEGHRGDHYKPRVTCSRFSLEVKATLIEPPCGSNTCVLDDGEQLLIFDGGFQCYAQELTKLLREIIPDYDAKPKSLVLTHGDIDHAGIGHQFDRIYVSQTVYDNFAMEHENVASFREQHPLHAPYSRLSKIITEYEPPALEKLVVIGKKESDDVLSPIGTLDFADLHFQVYEGNGGHVNGETVYQDTKQKIMFTGDNLVNIRGFSPDQKKFNVLAPYLMTSVNMESEEASRCRRLLQEWGKGYYIIPGHGQWLML